MNFRQVRKKIKTIQNVKKITNAMQMVSAVKMRKAQKLALEGREYRILLDSLLQKVMTKTTDISQLNIPGLTAVKGSKSKKLYIVISSNKGLCGGFHSTLFKFTLDTASAKDSEFITVGKKAADFLTSIGSPISADFSGNMPFVDNVSAIYSLAEERYVTGEYASVSLIYNRFDSSFAYTPVVIPLLPVTDLKSDFKPVEAVDKELVASDYLIEPSIETLLKPLIEDYLNEKIRSAIADSEASEHSARMMAMKNATDNAEDLAYSLTLLRNKLRQAQITNELLDMVSAKESSETND